jgi:Fungal protein of unknown function (DUF2015)
MAYILYSIVVLSIIVGTALYLTRRTWSPLLPERIQDILYNIPSASSATYSRLPSFIQDAESGMHSADFDLSSNITGEDSRAGLDPKSKRDIQRIMKVRAIGFDEARRVYMEQNFKKQGIGADGLPKDPKFVSFS